MANREQVLVMLNTINAATRYNVKLPPLPPITTLCCHPHTPESCHGQSKLISNIITPKACGNVYQRVIDECAVIRALHEI